MRDINGSKPTNFPLDEEKLPFKIPCPDRPPREKLLKLGGMTPSSAAPTSRRRWTCWQNTAVYRWFPA